VKGILARKIGMTEIFDQAGDCIPITLFEAGPCFVLAVKSLDEKRQKLSLGFSQKTKKNKPRKNQSEYRWIKEVEYGTEKQFKAGDEIKVDIFQDVKQVNVTGLSKGRGFTGVVKRHNFHGGPKTHGHRHALRTLGSIGACAFPGKVFKGKKMPGHYGNQKVTIKNLKLVRIDPAQNFLLVKGGVPGSNGSLVKITSVD
jgi:large subunit ribosomal protein L3